MPISQVNRILALETSCDDSSAAVVTLTGQCATVEACLSQNQDSKHNPFGGIVPEIACRNHTLQLLPLVEKVMALSGNTWADINAIAVTNRPGLIGSLLVGIVTAKTLAWTKKLPLVGVNHIEGHIFAPFLTDPQYSPSFSFDEPFLSLVVSGGHTHLFEVSRPGAYCLLGKTRDDAAGEAFDKVAKLLGLGFPGGRTIDALSQFGDPSRFSFPRALIHEASLDFSFSGLKTSAHRAISDIGREALGSEINNVCASFQEAVVDVLIDRLDKAVRRTGRRRVVITGGVSANSHLRAEALAWAKSVSVQLNIPPNRYCTDNAAMIGLAGLLRFREGQADGLELGPSARALPTDYQLAALGL